MAVSHEPVLACFDISSLRRDLQLAVNKFPQRDPRVSLAYRFLTQARDNIIRSVGDAIVSGQFGNAVARNPLLAICELETCLASNKSLWMGALRAAAAVYGESAVETIQVHFARSGCATPASP